jgi:hypothetical protein
MSPMGFKFLAELSSPSAITILANFCLCRSILAFRIVYLVSFVGCGLQSPLITEKGGYESEDM